MQAATDFDRVSYFRYNDNDEVSRNTDLHDIYTYFTSGSFVGKEDQEH